MPIAEDIQSRIAPGVEIELSSQEGCRTEVEAALRAANETLARNGLVELAPLSLARDRYELESWLMAQFRSLPREEHAGAEFRFELPALRRLSQGNPVLDAKELIRAGHAFIDERHRIAADVRSATNTALTMIGRHSAHMVPVDLVAVGALFAGAANYHLVIEVTTLGDDLRQGITRVHANGTRTLEEALKPTLVEHARREDLIERLQSEAADFWITGVASRILEAAGLTPSDAVNLLHGVSECSFRNRRSGEQSSLTTLWWDDGVLSGSFQELERDVAFNGAVLTFEEGRLPEAVVTASVGRRLGQVVEHALLPPDCVITKIDAAGGLQLLTLNVPRTATRLAA